MSYDFMSLEERMHFLVVTIAKKAFTHQEYNGQMIIGESEQLITEEYSISITMDVQVIDGEMPATADVLANGSDASLAVRPEMISIYAVDAAGKPCGFPEPGI